MARARNIKPGFFTNDRLSECEPIARLLFIGMWTIADRKGRLLDRPRKIKAEVFPYDNLEVEPMLEQLEKSGFIIRYEVSGVKCIHINNFVKHQKPHRNENESELPEYFPNSSRIPEQFGPKSEDFVPKSEHSELGSKHLALNDERGMMKEESGKSNDERGNINAPAVAGGCAGDNSFQLSNDPPKPEPQDQDPEPEAKPTYSESFLKWWAIYPRKEAKGEAQKSFDRAVRLIGANSGLTRPEAFNRILEVTQLFAESPAGNRGTMTPMPTTWLNQGRYDDDPAQWELTEERKASNGHARFSTASQRYSE